MHGRRNRARRPRHDAGAAPLQVFSIVRRDDQVDRVAE
jgi:hypothetical protein